MCIYTFPGPVTGLGYLHVTELDKQKDLQINIPRSGHRARILTKLNTNRQIDLYLYIYTLLGPVTGLGYRQQDRQIDRQVDHLNLDARHRPMIVISHDQPIYWDMCPLKNSKERIFFLQLGIFPNAPETVHSWGSYHCQI